MSTPFKMGNKFCLVRKMCKIPLNLKKQVCTNPVPCTPSYVDKKCFNICWGVVMFTSCFTMGKAPWMLWGEIPQMRGHTQLPL